MPELPSGTVTFLFTDIEGSTRLLARLPDRYGDLLAEHQRMLRAAFAEHGGHEVGTEGDSFFVVFARAPDALAAAVQAQRALVATRWPGQVELRVRMGVHTGEATLRGGDYVGLDVHRAARISAAARGGQVLVSGATRELVADELPAGVALRDLGGHRLKDLDRPVHLFGVVAGDLPADFPPPASLSTSRARIPVPPTATVGRDADLARLADVLADPATRLVTLVGPGGVGKTRVALELARDGGDAFRDGTQFVALAPVSDHEHVASTIARQLDLVLMPSETVEEGLARHLDDRDALLVLDNFEHVLDAAPVVAELVAATRRLRVLVTSREPLRVQAERLVRLDPLAVETAAVSLFLAVVRAQDAGFATGDEHPDAVTEVCRRLDGLPLAIELAAARIGVMSVPELAARLGDGLEALGTGPRDAPARQQTLTATLEWSYELLSLDEQAALAGLAVFAGGCTLDAAQSVTGASLDVLAALVAKNVVVHREDPARLMLLETVGEFARQKLAGRRDAAALRQRHLDYFLALATRAAAEIHRAEPPELLDELDLEVHNLRAALRHALDQRAAVPALELATALKAYLLHRQREEESVRWLDAALALDAGDVPAAVRAEALRALALSLSAPGTRDAAVEAANESLALARSIGDDRLRARSTLALASIALDDHRVTESYRYASEAEALARGAGDDPTRLMSTRVRALMAPTVDKALELGDEVAVEYRRMRSHRRLAIFQTSLTYTLLFLGDYVAARRIDAEARGTAAAIGDPLALGLAHGNHGLVTVLTGELDEAAQAFAQELELADRHRYHRLVYEAVAGLAAVAAARGEDEAAARLLGAAEAAEAERHDPVIAARIDDCSFTPARARLGEPAWTREHAAGAALSSREAIDAALGWYRGSALGQWRVEERRDHGQQPVRAVEEPRSGRDEVRGGGEDGQL